MEELARAVRLVLALDATAENRRPGAADYVMLAPKTREQFRAALDPRVCDWCEESTASVSVRDERRPFTWDLCFACSGHACEYCGRRESLPFPPIYKADELIDLPRRLDGERLARVA
ncbi:MAG TPA: hypothetical protein VKF62_14545, partial [Planctomycetota bacterium]|nr:hypothetical protein [Planctomycetota bacterium]